MGAIEDVIQQKQFHDDYHRAMVGVSYLYNVIDYIQQQLFKNYKITPQQFNVLRILRGQYPKPATVSLIKERMIDRNSDASRIVERLRKAGYAQRMTCKGDRRAVDVIITAKGLDMLKKLDTVIYDMDDPLRTLNKEEISDLNASLDTILSRWTAREKGELT